MVAYQNSWLTLHEDVDFFREAVLYTAGATGFSAALVEKDYFCSVLLAYLYQHEETPLAFRGGTSLGKIYGDFYRLSEDLDFVISMASDALRSQRRKAILPIKEVVSKIPNEIPIFGLSEGLRGYNNCKQYIGYVTYGSKVDISDESAKIKIEVGLREELLVPPARGKVRTLLMNPFTKKPAVPEFTVTALALEEAYAEKMRAALTRREPAIRDFYDIDFAATRLSLDLKSSRFIGLVTEKLKAPDNDPMDISPSRREILQTQLDTQLKPVLRPQDFERFDLDRAFKLLTAIGSRMQAYEAAV
jgi:predicted nucleotidyltransferase component of viral defense system